MSESSYADNSRYYVPKHILNRMGVCCCKHGTYLELVMYLVDPGVKLRMMQKSMALSKGEIFQHGAEEHRGGEHGDCSVVPLRGADVPRKILLLIGLV